MKLPNLLRGTPRRAKLAAAGGLLSGFVGGLAAGVARAGRRDPEHLRLLATASDVVFRYLPGPANRFDYVSPSVEAVTGYTVEEHYADPGLVRRLVHPDDWRVLIEAIRSDGPNASFELRWVRKSGETLWVEQRVALVRDKGGRVVAVEGIARDITARKEAEDALRESEERHRALFETIAQGVIYYDADGYITDANPAATEILGLTLDEMRNLSPLSRSWRAVREDGSDLPREERPVVVALQTGREVKGLILGFHPPVGETRWICFNAVPQFRPGNDHRPCGVHATMEDVTERKRAEHELRAAEERFRVAFFHAPIGIALATLDGRYQQVNPAMCEILGYSEGDLLGKSLREITHPDDLAVSLDHVRRLRAGEFDTYHLEKRYVCANGETVWASVNVSLVRDGRGEPLHHIVKIQDVSGRKAWERALAQSEERYRLVARATSEGILDADLVNDTLTWGGAAESLFGYSPDEPKKVGWWEERIHPEDRGRVMASVHAVLREGEAWSDEYRFRRADGSYAIVANRGCIVRDAEGVAVRMIGSMQDVTERREAETALKESEQRFRSLIQNSSDMITVVGADGGILYHSPSIERVLGHKPGSRVGKNVFESALIHPEDLPGHSDAIRKTLAEPGSSRTVEMRMLHRDGSWRHIEATMRNAVDESVVHGIVANSRDVTERKRTEAALRESEERFRLLAETANDLVCLHALDGRYIYVSPSSERLLGYSPDELVGANPYDLMHPEDAARIRSGPQEELLRGAPQVSATCRYRKKSGDYAWFETVTGLVRDERGRVFRLQTSSRDVSERKAAEDALAEAARAKTEFLADVSHELRTPLTVIRGNAEVGLQLGRDCVHGEGLAEIVRESARVSRMVEDLLFLARADSSDLPPAVPFVPEPVSVEPFLDGLARRAELLAREHGATLEAAHDEDAEGTLRVDHIRIEQAVLALVDNAAKYGPAGGRISLTSGIVTRDRASELRIEVSDEGPGIPPEDLPHVFERFYRSRKARDGGGTGLGLSIARTIVEAQGGRIEARSHPGEGTRMTIHLPLADEARPDAGP